MTYIEFFDRSSTENIAACLTHAPERVILIGKKGKLVEKYAEKYTSVFSDRHQEIEFISKTVSRSNLDESIELLQSIVDKYDNCVFDITGGEEILNVALGIVCERNSDKNIQIQRFNLENNRVYDCDKDGNTIYKDTPLLSVRENVRIYGGDIVYGNVDEDKTYIWNLDNDFRKDIDTIWNIYKVGVKSWNSQMSVLASVEEVGTVDKESLSTEAEVAKIVEHLAEGKLRYKIVKRIINDLIKKGLITRFYEDGETFRITYKNAQVKRCLTKAGQALEMKIYVMAKDAQDKGKNIYSDVVNGVLIDWDGECHDEETEDIYDTENEIDVFLMHNLVPVFVSCKSGRVTADELYKLETVAERFGSQYSRKVLVATSVSKLGKQGKYLEQRAEDMGIKIIDRVHKLTEVQLAREIKKLWLRPQPDNKKKLIVKNPNCKV